MGRRLEILSEDGAGSGTSAWPAGADVGWVVLDDAGCVRMSVGGAWEGIEGRPLAELVERADRAGLAAALERADGAAVELRALDASGELRALRGWAAARVGADGSRAGTSLLLVRAPSAEPPPPAAPGLPRPVVHELNNLLSLVLSYATLARSSIAGGPLAEDLDEVASAGRRAAELVRRALQPGRTPPQSGPVDLAAVVEGADLRRVVGERVRLILDCSPVPVAGPDAPIRALVLALVRAACARVPDPVAVTVRVAPGSDGPVDPGGAGATAVIVVGADGTLGDPPTAGPDPDPDVAALGGTLSCADLDTGVRYSVVLPGVPAPGGPRRPVRVLLVEDDPLLRALFSAMLSGGGHEVTAAADGAQARARVEAAAPQVIVLDRVLPDCVGPQLAIALRAACPDVGFVHVSGYAEGLEGLDGEVLAKPFEQETLLAAVERARRAVRRT